MGDGGKWVCGMSRYEHNIAKPCVIYSFGVNHDSTFEEEMLERTNCEIFGYDFDVSITRLDHLRQDLEPRTHFFQAGIAGKSDPTHKPPYYTISDLMKQNGHQYIDILKIDIEFAEFEGLSALNSFTSAIEFPVGQILVELHLFKSRNIRTSTFLDWWESFEKRGFRPTWTEPNLLATTLGIEDKHPRLAEYSWINVHGSRNILWD